MNPEATQRTTRIRKLSYSDMLNICTLLDVNDCWKEMIGHIRDKNGQPRYNILHVGIFERQRSPSKSLLDDWMTSNATVGDLLDVLGTARLQQVVEHVIVSILKEEVASLAPRIHYPNAMTGGGHYGAGRPGTSNHLLEGIALDAVPSSTVGERPPPALPAGDFGPLSSGQGSSLQYWQLQSMCSGFDEAPLHCGGRLLGRGGFGSVFLGIDSDGKKFAIKKLNCSQASVKQAALQFERELQVLTSCTHPNLLALVDFVRGSSADSHCIVYEFMENGSLEDRLARKGGTGSLSPALRLKIAVGAAAGVAHLHAFRNPSPIVHRDIKSANILLDAQYVAKVGDFGLAKLFPEDATNVMTGTVIGTTCYMPPESLQFKVTPKWDVYSYGVVLLEILTGLPSMDNNREERSLYRHVMENTEDDDIMPLADNTVLWQAAVANSVFKISRDCMSPDYHHRPDMAAVQLLLEGLSH